MGLFDIFKKKDMPIGSPLKGKCVSIKDVSDPTFADEILGKGIAIIPEDGRVYAPADGQITTIFPTGHAVGMTTEDGVELLIHVGIDTVSLQGEGFKIIAKDGQTVKKGDLLLDVNLEKVRKAGYDIITPVIVCNTGEFAEINTYIGKSMNIGDTIMEIKK